MGQSILAPILLSLRVASLATLFTLGLGLPLARLFTHKDFKGKDALEALMLLPLVLPPSVVGYLLLLLFGRRGPLGQVLERFFGVSLIFTWMACVLAGVVVSFPLMYQNLKSAFLGVDPLLEDAGRSLGAGEAKVFFRITLPLAWPGLVSGLVLSFARALGEFGATMMIAGNIPGQTQTIPLALYYAVESGDRAKANVLLALVLVFSFLLIYSLNRWLKGQQLH